MSARPTMLVAIVVVAILAGVNAQCPTIYMCAGAGQSCARTATTETGCNAGLYLNYSSTGECTCSPLMSYTLGAACTAGQRWENHECTTSPYHGINENRWFSIKRIGDQCSTATATTAYDCMPPRSCVSGKCAANLQIGEVCWNQTVSSVQDHFGLCPINAYCRTYSLVIGILIDVGRCEARIALGEKCPFTQGERSVCADGLTCVGATTSTAGVCGLPMAYELPAGVIANYTSQCESGVISLTNGACLDYTTMYNAANAKKGLSCNETSQCGNWEDARVMTATCSCNNLGTRNAAVCTGYRLGSPTALRTEAATRLRLAQQAYAAGCETEEELGSSAFDGMTSCARFDYSDDLSATCAIARLALANGAKDCSGYYTAACGGALQTMSISFGMLAMLMLASLIAA